MHSQLKTAYRLPSMFLALVGLTTMTPCALCLAQPEEIKPDVQPADSPASPASAEPVLVPPADPPPATKSVTKSSPPLPAKEHDADAVAKLEQATKAIKDAKSLRFKTSFAVEGLGKDMMGTCSATVVALHENNAWSFRLTGKGRYVQKVPETDFDLVYTAGNLEWLDTDAKKLMIKPVSQAKSKLLQASSSLKNVTEMFGPNPFAGQNKSVKLHMGAEEKAGGVDCEVVVGEAADGSSAQKVFLGKEDHIPRRYVLERKTQTRGDMTITTELTDMQVGTAVSASEVHLALPEGYTKEQAPAAVKPTLTARPTPIVKPDSGNPKPNTGTDEAIELANRDPMPVTPNEGGPAVALPVQPADGTAPTAQTSPTPAPPATKPPTPAPVEITSLPEFELKDAKGAKVTAASLHGSPSVILFWGTWSLSSKKALPELATLADLYKDKAKVYSIAVRQKDPQSAIKLLTEGGYAFPLLLEGDTLADALHVGSYPALYVFGRDGELLKGPSGHGVTESFAEARAALDSALGLAPTSKPAAEPKAAPKLEPKSDPKVEADK